MTTTPQTRRARPWQGGPNHTALINDYVVACRGNPDKYVYGNTTRQRAVADVEEAVAAITNAVSDQDVRITEADAIRREARARAAALADVMMIVSKHWGPERTDAVDTITTDLNAMLAEAERDGSREPPELVRPGFVSVEPCPGCFHTRCGEDCTCNCDAERGRNRLAEEKD